MEISTIINEMVKRHYSDNSKQFCDAIIDGKQFDIKLTIGEYIHTNVVSWNYFLTNTDIGKRLVKSVIDVETLGDRLQIDDEIVDGEYADELIKAIKSHLNV